MPSSKAHIIAQLQKEILPLQGFKAILQGNAIDVGLGPVVNAFPGGVFPLGAAHEFLCSEQEDLSASSGFIAGILSSVMRRGGAAIWIAPSPIIFPPAFSTFGVAADQIIFVHLQKQKDILWATEEALKCAGLAAVIAEFKDFNFAMSRRLQLAVEHSRVTGFILRKTPQKPETTACIARWKISSLSSNLPGDMPGVGFPRWNIQLLKARNGKPGTWQMEWSGGRFHHLSKVPIITAVQQKKTG